MLITRKQYMDREYSHDEYYGQWVTDALMNYVVNSIGSNKLLNSTNEHLNDIPMQLWDRLSPMSFINREGWIISRLSVLDPDIAEANRIAHQQRSFAFSLSDAVCVSKAAARKYILANKVVQA